MRAVVTLQRLAANNAWSNLRLHRACAKLTTAAFEAPGTSFFPSLPLTLNHILTVDWYYLDALEGGTLGLKAFEPETPHPTLATLTPAQSESDQRLVAFTLGLHTEADLDREVRLDRGDHTQVECVEDVLLHLFTHQTHHRGQAHALLSGTAIKPPQLDEFFMREELPLRADELRDLGLPQR